MATKKARDALAKAGIAKPDNVVAEFDLSSIEEEQTLRHAAKRITDRIDVYVGLLESLLQPDANIASMHEIGFFTETEFAALARAYRTLMRALRVYAEADLHATDDAYANAITQMLAAWNAEKEHLVRITKKLQDGWSKEQKLHLERGYFG